MGFRQKIKLALVTESAHTISRTLLPPQTKVKHLKKTAEILKRDYDCDIPDTVEGLCKLPGVGPKMAHICMNVAWKKQSGIGKSYLAVCDQNPGV